MARWHSLGLLILVAGCSLETGPNSASLTPNAGTPIWSPSRRPSGSTPPQAGAAGHAAHDAGKMDAASPSQQDAAQPEPDPNAADASHSQSDAGAPSTPAQMSPPPATSANDPTPSAKPPQDAGASDPAHSSPNGSAADGGMPKPANPQKTPTTPQPSNGDPNKGSSKADNSQAGQPASGMNTAGKEASSGNGDNNSGRGSRRHSDESKPDDDSADTDKRTDSNTGSDKAAATQPQGGGLTLLFTSISNLVFSILEFSFGPAQPQNISNLVVSIVALATLPAGEATTSALADVLEQLDASNVCHDDRAACESLCETLVAACDLFKSDPRSVRSVERNCGAKSLASCK